ncbi:hypothetical protein GBAR_LOCUS2142 [Geodia barretti]|uniref:Uncharacterized protein n=1 Tax=Geodia barretti TaxID=519541 RepID=A0AA35W2G6_GEOBA|nr:hypothetical protein GBAR_LOCUS2142 [Geodia barretti]
MMVHNSSHSHPLCCSTPYMRSPRYTYVDRDYAYSEAERREIQWHRDHYLHYLRHSQALRLWNRRERAL